jgi:hypothetical protein
MLNDADEAAHRGKRLCVAASGGPERAGFADISRLDISEQVDVALEPRNKEHFKSTFASFKDPETKSIGAISLELALNELGINVRSEDIAEVIECIKSRCARGIDDADRRIGLEAPSPIEEWVRAMPLSKLVADAMPKNDSCLGKDQLRYLSEISLEELKETCEVIRDHMFKTLQEQLIILKKAYTQLDTQIAAGSNEKFKLSKMSVGNIENFHQGLSSRIGKIHAPLLKIILATAPCLT